MIPPVRPRRSCLYVPGANANALAKAPTLAADVLLFDLEDSVAPEAKAGARAAVAAALRTPARVGCERIVRINALAGPWGGDDLAAIVGAAPAGVLAPKIETAADVAALDAALTAVGFGPDTALWIMIETPRALFNLADIAAAARRTRPAAFVLGLNDLAKDTRAQLTPDRAPFHAAMSLAVAAARAESLTVIDGVFNQVADEEGFRAECAQGRAFGFDGKSLIHPSQIGVCNDAFAPSSAEVDEARAIVAAFARPENAGRGVLKIEGRMVELLHRDQALRVLALDDVIGCKT